MRNYIRREPNQSSVHFSSTAATRHLIWVKYEPRHIISYKIACASNEYSDQLAHTHILSRKSAIRRKKPWMFGYPWSTRQ